MMKFTPTLAVAMMAMGAATPAVLGLDPTFTMYVPLPDDDLLEQVFEKINSRAASPVTDMISVAVPTTGTVIYYDHWEDGFDLTQDTTEVWGDGDESNGCAPSVTDCTNANDVFKAGDVVILKNEVPCQRRNVNQVRYDGGDLLKSTHPIVMTRAAFPAGPGSMMAGAVEVFDTSKWGTSFIAPVGQNLGHTTSAYQFTALAVMSGEDGTEVTLNNKDTVDLDQGKSIIIRVNQGDTVTSTKPVQVHLITGDIGSTYELRWYALAPTNQWSTTAYAPVGDSLGKVKVALYNPSTSGINVKCTFTGGATANIYVPPKRVRYTGIIRDNKAAKFESDDIFFAFSSTDTSGSGQIYDWGYPLMTGEQLTPQAVVGLGFGCTDNKCDTSGERSIVWVTTVEDAEVWVDFNNDGTVDDHFYSAALSSHTITDDQDEDMSGAVIWATEKGDKDGSGKGVKLAAAWGQKAALSRSGDMKALDLGTVVVPFEPTYTSCSIEILEDVDGDGVISTGDLVEETIEVLNVGNFAIDDDTFAVQTGGGIVKLAPMEIRGDLRIYKTQYRVPLGETVLGSCEIVPYDPQEPVAPEPEPQPQPEPDPKSCGAKPYPPGMTPGPYTGNPQCNAGGSDTPLGFEFGWKMNGCQSGSYNLGAVARGGGEIKGSCSIANSIFISVTCNADKSATITWSGEGTSNMAIKMKGGNGGELYSCEGSNGGTYFAGMNGSGRGRADISHIEICLNCVGPACYEPEPEPAPKSAAPQPKEPKTQPPAPDSPSQSDESTDQAFSKGDPHFKTFGGELYDYHGECDLVLLHNPDFKNGLGMDIHIRTKIENFWSSIESAAIKIGDGVMEIKADPQSDEWLWFNGDELTSGLLDGEWNQYQLGGFLVRYKSNGPTTREANLYLQGSKEVMVFKTFKSFVRIDINHKGSDNYFNSVGLLGSHAHQGRRLGRDGQFIEDVNAFGQEWQVIPEVDGSLFHSYAGAVVGKKCVMPPEYHEGDSLNVSSLRGRRLGASSLDQATAEKACNHLVDPEERKACVFDVLATQDLNMASTW